MVLGYIGPQSVFEGPQSVFEGPYKDLRVCFEGPQNVSWRARTQNVDLKDLRMCSGVACTPDKQNNGNISSSAYFLRYSRNSFASKISSACCDHAAGAGVLAEMEARIQRPRDSCCLRRYVAYPTASC